LFICNACDVTARGMSLIDDTTLHTHHLIQFYITTEGQLQLLTLTI